MKSLVHYPDVVKWMDENIEWTKQVGEAFLTQPAEVMKSIQRLRAAARAAGTLVDTPQQLVAYDQGAITIVPAQPEIIYVPRYSPEYVYVRQPDYYYSQPFLTFGMGFAAGAWLTHDLDWRSHRIWVVNRHWNWRDHRDWRRPVFPGQAGYVASPYRQPWSPPPNVVRPPISLIGRGREFSRPTPMAGTPTPTFAAKIPAENQVAPPQPVRRDRDNARPRPAAVAVQTAPQGPQPAQAPPTAAPPISMRVRTETNAPDRRAHPSPAMATNRPAPNATAVPQPTFAATTTPERSFPFAPATSQVVAPLTGPVVSAFQAPPAPHPRIAFPATSASAPAPAARPTPQPAAHRPPPATTTTAAAPAPAPATKTPPLPPRDDKDNKKRVEP